MPTRFASPWWRRLVYALAASLSLHGVLLLPGVALQSPAVRQQALRAVLQAPPTVDAPLPERLVQAASPVVRASASHKSARPVPQSEARMIAVSAHPATAESPVTEADGIDGDGLRAYRIALAVAARRQRPAVSVGGLAGRVDLQVTVDAMGPRVSVATSSGQVELDAAALQMMRLAVADAVIPATLRGHVFVLEVPVLFGASP